MSATDASRRATSITLALITLGALVLRAYHLADRVPWLDEADTRMYVEGSLFDSVRAAYSGPPVSLPPAYFLIANLLARLHLFTWAHYRVLPMLLGVASVPLIFLLGRRLWSARAGLIAALLLALSPLHVMYSREARGYSLFVLATIVLLYGAIGVAEHDEAADRSWFLVGGILASLSHHAGVPLVAVVGAWTLWRRPTRWTFFACVVLSLVALPTAIQLWRQTNDPLEVMRHAPPPMPGSLANFKWGIVNELGVGNLLRQRDALVVSAFAWLIGSAFLAWRRFSIFVLFVAAAVVPIAMLAYPKSTYGYYARYALSALPIGCAIVGVGLASLSERRSIPIVGSVVAAAILVAWIGLGVDPLRRELHEVGTPYDELGALIAEFGDPQTQRVFIASNDVPVGYMGWMSVGALRPHVPAAFSIEFQSMWTDKLPGYDPEHAFIVAWAGNYGLLPKGGTQVTLGMLEADELEIKTFGRGGGRTGLVVRLPSAFDQARTTAFIRRARALHPRSWAASR